ncbi:uncharacterized protein LOC125520862 isoform X2 [Triticum urartu]|uniref:uncharacterized protein LOC125520862 isoform X2 n=1 Tax=Triticum urartu TaxID=4572 RepID=UPI00204441B6|nr:uncharacterized protein LOC125520862 isoform X2 [Triticum urartu]
MSHFDVKCLRSHSSPGRFKMFRIKGVGSATRVEERRENMLLTGILKSLRWYRTGNSSWSYLRYHPFDIEVAFPLCITNLNWQLHFKHRVDLRPDTGEARDDSSSRWPLTTARKLEKTSTSLSLA